MKLIIKKFDDLSAGDLYELMRLRSDVFVVEQECIYQDLDGKDREALHVYYAEEDGSLAAYLRVLPRGLMGPEVAIGRVIAVKRGVGMGNKIIQAGLQAAQDEFGAEKVYLEAQSYALGFYEKNGFKPIGEEFVEDGIPHIPMMWEKGE